MKSNLLTALLIAFTAANGFAQGYYLEYKMTTSVANASSTMKTYYQDGNARTEVAIVSPNFSKTFTTLLLKSTPGKVYMLDPEQKTYREDSVGNKNGMDESQQSDYEVTVLGNEKVNGYNSTHVKVVNIKTQSEQEFWTSTEVSGYAEYLKVKTKYTGKENLTKALAAKGAMGFPVRIKAMEKMGAIQLDLVKAAKQSNPGSLFSLDGYTKSASPSSTGQGTGVSQQEMMQKMQNMTPEERQKYIQQLMQQQQQSQPH